MDYSGHFKLLNNIFYYLLCRKTIANVIITVLKNYICVHMKNILFMINFIHFEVWAFSFSSRGLSRLSCINEYLAIYNGGHVSE